MKQAATPSRLDSLLHVRGLAKSREEARALILSGAVSVNGQRRDKAGTQVAADAEIAVQGERCRYVGRGGLKLEGALDHFGIDVTGTVALDVGASTGGFTDCLLQRGAKKVFAVDVGYGQIAWKLRIDPRVVLIERQNVRTLPPEAIGEPVDRIVIDVSFISLEKVIPCVVPHLREGGGLLALIKPQFEVGYGEVGAGGIVRDAAQHRQVVDRICGQMGGWGLKTLGTVPSPILGKEGNREFLICGTKGDP